MLQNIFIKTFNKQSNKNQQHIVVPVLPNGHSSRRSWHATSESRWSNVLSLVGGTLLSTTPFALFLVTATPSVWASVRTEASFNSVSAIDWLGGFTEKHATVSTVAPQYATSLEGSTRAVEAGLVPVFVHCTWPVNNLNRRNEKIHDSHFNQLQSILRFVHQMSMYD